MGKYCPLTLLEIKLRKAANSEPIYEYSFIAHYLEKIVYPSVPPAAIIIPTAIIALTTIIVYAIHPPKQIAHIFKKSRT